MSVVVVMQQDGTEWTRISLETLAAGAQLAHLAGAPLQAAVLGNDIEELVASLRPYPIAGIYVLEHPLLAEYTSEGFTIGLEQLISLCQPSFVLFPHTYQVRDYAPKLAARFGSSLVSDIIGMQAEAEGIFFLRQLYLGKLLAVIPPGREPAFVSVQAGAFSALRVAETAGSPPSGTIEKVRVYIDPEQIASQPEPSVCETNSSQDLQRAKTVVAGGRGLKSKEDLALVHSLALEMGAPLAASRPVCDNGWVPMDHLVGTSGQAVAPDLYIAVGISGAIQHMLGVKGAKTLVAINQDESAPIFDSAQYGIVGDLRAVVPALIEEVKKLKS